MAGRVLKAEDRAHFLGQMRRQVISAVYRRVSMLFLDDGWTHGRVTPALSPDEAIVAACLVLYETQDRKGVERLTYLGPSSLLDASQQGGLSFWVDAEVLQTVCQQAAAAFGASMTPMTWPNC